MFEASVWALVCTLVILWLVFSQTTPHVKNALSAGMIYPHVGASDLYPDPALTPGATNPAITQSTIGKTICNPQWRTSSIRPSASYTTTLKKKQLHSTYHGKDTEAVDFEEDHLISLELGGNPTDEQNLWPEPYHTSVSGVEMGAHQKDTVENWLHTQVCTGALTLVQAQQEIARDWFAVYTQLNPNPRTVSVTVVYDDDDETQ